MTDDVTLFALSIACGVGAGALAALVIQVKRLVCRWVFAAISTLLNGCAESIR